MNETLADYLRKKQFGLQVARQGVMIDDQAKVMAMTRNKERRHQSRIAALQGLKNEPAQVFEEEDGMIHVGDVVVHQHMPAPQSPAATETPAPDAPTSSPVSKLGAIAALLAGVLGAGATGGAILGQAGALSEGVAQLKVLWDGHEISPGQSAEGRATQTVPPNTP
jgi:hypothetical protein